MEYLKLNKYQTQITEELIESLPKEVSDNLLECITSIPFIKNLISDKRERAKDRPRDAEGKIIVDLSNPHILENMEYFLEAALYYKKHGVYNKARPNANVNSEYGKWIRLERDRCWNGMIRPEDGEWIPGALYFYINYCPIIQSKIRKGTKLADRIVDFPEIWEGIYWRFHYMHQARNGGLYNDFMGSNHGAELASRGKAFAYSLFVETPQGRKLWGDIKIGDDLFGPDGTITKVVDIPFDQEYDIYKMTLIDGREIYTTLEHLWKINKNGENWNKLYTTKQIMESNCISRFAIEMPKEIKYEKQEVPINPYLLGLMLGDGSFTISKYNQALFSSKREDVEIYEKILNIKFKLVNTNRDLNWLIPYQNFGKKAKELGLNNTISNNKFIPDIYKYNTKEVRINVLKGLLDTDGSVHDCGKPEFYTTSKKLAEDVMWVVRSLGFNASCWTKLPKYKSKGKIKEGLTCYIVYIYTDQILFNLPRKQNLCHINGSKNKSRVYKTSIKSIEYSHREKAKCVTVNREDGLFLIGDFVVTHNSKSYSMASILTRNFVLGENKEAWKETRSIVTAYQKEYLIKDGVLNKFVSMADFVAQHTQFPRKRLKSALLDMNWVMGYKDAELNIEKGTQNQVLGVSSKDDESKLRGKRAIFIGIEEFGCHLGGTEVLMFDGSIKLVEDIVIGDILMGDDNTPRVVKELYTGIDLMYKVTLSNGDYLIVNSKHPIYFKKYDWNIHSYTLHLLTAPELLNIDIRKGYYISKAPIKFPHKNVFIDPYFLGLWLGDGSSSRLDISNLDPEVLNWLSTNYNGIILDLKLSKTCKNYHISVKDNPLHTLFKSYNLYNNKHIPKDYKINSKDVLLLVVAGLIDSDGTYHKNKNYFEITLRFERKHILEDLKFICTSNGLKCKLDSRLSNGKKPGILHWRLRISGDLSIIPTKVLRKKGILNTVYRSRNNWNDYTFKVEPFKEDTFYGFTVDKNNLFVLGDLTITHNTFARLIDLYNVLIPSVLEGDYVFGLMYLLGTAGDNESDFAGAQEIMYNPVGYNMYALPNVYDKLNQGKKLFVFFYPGYINRKGFYNENGVSDVIGALISILKERYRVKYNSTDPNTIIKTIAEVPITPAEAIIKTGVNLFPVIDLTERLNQLDNNPREFDDVYTGDLIIDKSGQILYKNTSKNPIRTFKGLDNLMEGAVEIFQMPEKDNSGKVFINRYILSCDPYDNDLANSKSLGSIFVLDLWTDRIVAEYTGRPLFADDFYEIARRMCLFFNGRMNYENNKKGLFAYFQKMNSLYLLTDTLEFLKDKDMVKSRLFGNNTKGTTATEGINSYARTLLRNWLLRPITMLKKYQDEEEEIVVARLFTLRTRALIEELISYNDVGNFDRVSSMMMLMLLREDRMVRYNGNLLASREEDSDKNYLGNDPFFERNYRFQSHYNK